MNLRKLFLCVFALGGMNCATTSSGVSDPGSLTALVVTGAVGGAGINYAIIYGLARAAAHAELESAHGRQHLRRNREPNSENVESYSTPNPGDSDADGLTDVVDNCPREARGPRPSNPGQVYTWFQGCRPTTLSRTDNDHDGVFDDEDQCPNQAREAVPATQSILWRQGCPVSSP